MSLLLGLSVLLLWRAASLLARRMFSASLAEQALATSVTLAALALAPLYALGLAGSATRGALAFCYLGQASGVVLMLAKTEGSLSKTALLAPPASLLLFVRTLRRALTETWASAAVLVLALLVFTLSLLQTFVLPSDAWDGIWYHDTMTGTLVSTGGLGPIGLPANLTQQANGFPRAAELTCALFVLIWDRSLIELPNLLAAIPLALATSLLARRHSDMLSAAAFGCAVLLIPGVALQLRSTYVDVFYAAWLVAAAHYCFKPHPLQADSILGACALGLCLATKPQALTVAPLLLLVLLLRHRSLWQKDALALFGWLLLTLPALLALGATYGRNALLFDNPLWPYGFSLGGRQFPGVVSAASADVSASVVDTLLSIFLPAPPGRDYPDLRSGGYGLAAPYIVLPLCMAALATSLGRTDRRKGLLLLALPLWIFVTSPALWSARYQIAALAVMMGVAAWVPLAPHWRGRLALLTALPSVLQLARSEPELGGASLVQTAVALSQPASERAAKSHMEYFMEERVARARATDLSPEYGVLFGPGVTFPSLLWREQMDNPLYYTEKESPAELARLLLNPKIVWVVEQAGAPLERVVRGRPHEWELIGHASRGQPTVAYRRRGHGDL